MYPRPAMRFGTVALVGRTNVGKSTLLNAVLGEPLAITSPLPQTTRDALLGVMRRGDAQIAFLDTPGVHRPRTELGRRMNTAAYESARSADVVVLMTDMWDKAPKGSITGTSPSPLHNPWIRPGDREVIEGTGLCPRCSGPLRIELSSEQPIAEVACTADGVRLTIALPIPADLVDL